MFRCIPYRGYCCCRLFYRILLSMERYSVCENNRFREKQLTEPQLPLLMQGKQSTYQTPFRPAIPHLIRLISLMRLTLLAMLQDLDVTVGWKGDGARFVSTKDLHLQCLYICRAHAGALLFFRRRLHRQHRDPSRRRQGSPPRERPSR